MAPLSAQSFSIQQQGAVAVFTLDRPQVKNALLIQTYEELRDAFRACASEDTVEAVVLTGAQGNFCSGGDVHQIIGQLVKQADDAAALRAFNQLTSDSVAAMRTLGKPIIAAIDGVAAGGGAALALAADLRIGTDRCQLSFLFPRVGLSAADMGVTWLLPRLVGLGRATELLFFGQTVKAQAAHSMGLLNHLCPPQELADCALTWAQKLCEGPRFALSQSKALLEDSASLSWVEALEKERAAQVACMQHADFQEGYAAFVERRKPRF